MNIADLLVSTRLVGGGTLDMGTMKLADHSNGFYVGGETPTVTIPESEFSENTLTSAVTDVAATGYVGTWTHEGMVYVDAVTYVKDSAEALKLARTRGELAVYDIAGNTELMV